MIQSNSSVVDRVINEKIKKYILRIGTLGPEGTSSEYVSKQVANDFFQHKHCAVILFKTFELAIQELLDGRMDMVIVPHAYEKINEFYMNPFLEILNVFVADTPVYGLVARADYQYDEGKLELETIVTHPAPVPLVSHFMESELNFEFVTSTSEAARKVRDRERDLAITNEEAANRNKLMFIKRFTPIQMGWSIFVKAE